MISEMSPWVRDLLDVGGLESRPIRIAWMFWAGKNTQEIGVALGVPECEIYNGLSRTLTLLPRHVFDQHEAPREGSKPNGQDRASGLDAKHESPASEGTRP